MTAAAVGVIGAGGMGSRHAQNLHRLPGVEVVAVADPDGHAAGALADATGAAILGADELIMSSEVDAVVVASPDETHADLTVACLEAGKPVLCEKPMATTAEDAQAVLDAEVRAGRRLAQIGFMRVYDPAHVELKHAVDEGRIGRPLHVRAVHLNPPWIPRSAETVIVQSAIHDIHSVRWLLGGEIDRVATQVVPRDDGSARLVVIQCWLADERAATVFVDAHSYGYEIAVEVTGETGTIVTDPQGGLEVRRNLERRRAVPDGWLDRFDAAYAIEGGDWVGSVIAGVAPPGPSVWDGYVATHVATAAIRSAATRQAEPVDHCSQPALYDESTDR